MRKYVTISLFIFWAITVAVITAGLISYNNQSITGSNAGGVNQVGGVSGANSTTTQKTLNLNVTELARHNSSKSCWLLISGKIYDVTTFLNQHPGNASTILPTCGTDATSAYATRGGNGSHSSSATAMLADYFIGNLGQTVVTSSTNPTNPPVSNPTTVPTTRRGQEDDD